MREYPLFDEQIQPQRSISFICVKFSDEFNHNLNISECVHDKLNEFIVIDNTSNLFYSNLGQAINAGIRKAKNDLLVIVHEDVVLLPGWQSKFEASLIELEAEDSDWLVIGVIGWGSQGEMLGHVSDPHSYRDSLGSKAYSEVTRIDEQVLVLRKSRAMFPDENLPSIHHIGRDLPLEAERRGKKSYVLNAASIHKYATADGKLIQIADDSEKIRGRGKLAYLADRACSDEYIINKWSVLDDVSLRMKVVGHWRHAQTPKLIDVEKSLDNIQQKKLNSPVILLAKGGSGSRLLSSLAEDVQLFIGSELNETGDSREMARSIYRALIRKFRCTDQYQKSLIIKDLITSAVNMLESAGWPEKWGFKLPESLFILPELKQAFPRAKYVILYRDPLSITLRRTHMTARLDNQIGQITLAEAYDALDLQRAKILIDTPTVRMAIATIYQLNLLLEFEQLIEKKDILIIKFEEMIQTPLLVLELFASFNDLKINSQSIEKKIDFRRAFISENDFDKETIDEVKNILRSVRINLHYL